MFYCDPCREERGWPESMTTSRGRCELCSTVADCNDVPSRFLPIRAPSRPKIHKINTLPKPECRYGYTHAQIDAIMGDRVNEFHRWMGGQTVSVCDGHEWNYDSRAREPTGCGPHGVTIYRSDVEQFLRGGRPLD